MEILFVLAAFIAGGCIIISSTLNAQMAKRVGAYKSALINNVLAAFTALIILIILYGGFSREVAALKIAPLWSLAGGLLAVAIVVGSNIIIPKIPVVHTVLFIFSGQFLIGILIDAINNIPISYGKVVGFLCIIAGLLYNVYVDKAESKAI
ncbi:MAG: DMT family transporter [Clostridiaceae bacterium]|nr:DMT family transporter [Clostridiaceae bacterium]